MDKPKAMKKPTQKYEFQITDLLEPGMALIIAIFMIARLAQLVA
jgi:hypothetical protein